MHYGYYRDCRISKMNCLLIVLVVFGVPHLWGQGINFDVVSIRQSGTNASWDIGFTRNDYHAIGMPIGMTFKTAYFARVDNARDMIRGAPDWIWNDRYDFVAKVSDSDVEVWKKDLELLNPVVAGTPIQRMLQNVLIQRCHLTSHFIPTTKDGYALRVGKRGLNDKKMTINLHPDDGSQKGIALAGDGHMIPYIPGKTNETRFIGVSLNSLAKQLSLLLNAQVEDQSGISGRYDFLLERTTDPLSESESIHGDPGFQANRYKLWKVDALGLELVPIKIPTRILVIDHVDRPSAN